MMKMLRNGCHKNLKFNNIKKKKRIMEIKNVIISELPNGLLRLKPVDGFVLFDKKSHRTFSNADVSTEDLLNWTAQAIEQ